MTKKTNKILPREDMIEKSYKIIVIEDDDGLSFLIRKRLKREGFQIDWAENGKEALSKITGEPTEILLVDYKLPDMTGKELIEKLTKKFHKPPYFISMTGFGDEKIAVELMKLGAHDYIVKEADFINVLIEKLKRTCVIIDKQRKLEEIELALKESELNYHALYETMAEGVVYQNDKGEIMSANPAAERILGLSYSQMIGVTSMDPGWKAVDENKQKLPGEKHPAMVALSTGKPIENYLQGIYNPKKKDYVWIIVNSIPQFKEGSSKPFQVYSTFLDVTLRINAEENLRKQRELLLETGKMAIVGGWELNLENNKLVFSDITKEIHEVPSDFKPTLVEAINFYPPETRPIIENAVQKAINKGISYNLEVPFITAKSHNIWVNAIGKPEMKGGKCVRLHGTFQDITKRKNKEEELKLLNQQLVANEQQLTAANQQLIANEQQLLTANQQLKASEDHLIELNSQLSLAQNIAKIGYWTYDIKTQTPKWTEECFKMFNIPIEEGEPDYPSQKKYIHPDDWNLYDGSVQKLISKNIPYDIQIRLVHNNGNIVWMRTKGFPGKTINKKVTELYGIVQDITEFKNSEKQLIDAKQQAEESKKELFQVNTELKVYNNRLESLTKILKNDFSSQKEMLDYTLLQAISLTDSKIGYIYFYNEEKKEFLLNTWSGEVMKQCAVTDPETIYQLDSTGCWGEAVRQRKPFFINNYSLPNEYKKGTPKGHVQLKNFLTIPVIVDDDIKAVIGVANKKNNYNDVDVKQLSLLMDAVWKIVERNQHQKDIIKAKEKAEEADRLKSAFLANMSHEIRTPMNGILGFTNLLLEPNLTGEEQQKYIEIIQKSGDRMLNTVNDIIDISKIESGLVEVSVSEVNINEQLRYFYSFFKPEAAGKGIQLTLKSELSEKNIIAKTDIDKFHSILTNLIKNAIKFTKKGIIELGCNIKADKDFSELEISVRDTGIGIPKDRQNAIFERFVQADIEDKNAMQGSGLGLAISKAYAEMLGGNLWVESDEGIGSIFYLRIPYQNSENIRLEETIHDSNQQTTLLTKKLKILIAEDDQISFEHLSIVLQNTAKEIIHAETGIEAVDICRKNPDIDIILMDIRMPGLDGYEATRRIREFNKDVIIIAQTAYAMVDDRASSIKAGCNDYITKPIKKDRLLEKIRTLLKPE